MSILFLLYLYHIFFSHKLKRDYRLLMFFLIKKNEVFYDSLRLFVFIYRFTGTKEVQADSDLPVP